MREIGDIDWKEMDAQQKADYERHLTEAKKKSGADRDFFGAALKARWAIENENLLPRRDENGELHYTIKQGLKAACHAREDVATTSQVQLAILKRLDRNRNLLYIVIFLLLLILSNLK